MAVNSFIRGKNAVLTLNINGAAVDVRVKSFAVDEIVTEGADNTCGEDRARPFIVCDYFEIGFQAFLSDMSLVDTWLSMLADEDANVAPQNAICNLKYNLRNGTTKKYLATESTRRALKIDASARGEAVMFPNGFRSRYFKPTQ